MYECWGSSSAVLTSSAGKYRAKALHTPQPRMRGFHVALAHAERPGPKMIQYKYLQGQSERLCTAWYSQYSINSSSAKRATRQQAGQQVVAYINPGTNSTGSARSKIVTNHTRMVEPYIATSQAAAITGSMGLSLARKFIRTKWCVWGPER